MTAARAEGKMQPMFAERRRRFLEGLGAHAAAVLPAAPVAIRNGDVEHDYRQDSDLYYLTGFDEPQSVALFLPDAEKEKFVLLVRPRDKDREVWDGPRAGVEGAASQFGADAAYPIGELPSHLAKCLENVRRLYFRLGRDRVVDDIVLRAVETVRSRARHGIDWPVEVVEPGVVLHEMRLLKDEQEIARMRRAAAITADGFARAIAETRPDRYEYEIEAVLRHAFRSGGSERPAYQPIVGSGPNATILHHRRNDRQMRSGELLLIDAGAEYGFYAADVTRTFPVGGKFTQPQRSIYEIVLGAQTAAIAATRPGATIDEIHRSAVDVVVQGLFDLGILHGERDEAIEKSTFKPYFMHRTSHWLGMDVHDVGRYFIEGQPRRLEPGMVLTVEPGIYIAPDCADVAPEYRGIGIRIEDDVAVTAGGSEVLTSAIPKDAAALERT